MDARVWVRPRTATSANTTRCARSGTCSPSRTCDEIIVSTLPHGFSSWLHQDLPHRAERVTGLPVTVVSAAHPAAS